MPTLAYMATGVLLLDGLLCMRLDRERRLLPALKSRFETHTRPPSAVGSLASYTPAGERVLDSLPAGSRLAVLFVLHKGREQEEASVWQAVASTVADPAIVFVGYCEDRDCLSRLTEPRFLVVVDATMLAVRTVASHGANGHFVVVGDSLSVIRSLPWSDAPQMAKQINAIDMQVSH